MSNHTTTVQCPKCASILPLVRDTDDAERVTGEYSVWLHKRQDWLSMREVRCECGNAAGLTEQASARFVTRPADERRS
jgi:hypothetical protein